MCARRQHQQHQQQQLERALDSKVPIKLASLASLAAAAVLLKRPNKSASLVIIEIIMHQFIRERELFLCVYALASLRCFGRDQDKRTHKQDTHRTHAALLCVLCVVCCVFALRALCEF